MCALAEAHDVLVIPHNPLGPVSTAACLQICASIPNLGIQELPGFCLNGAEDKMVKEPLRFENGCMLIRKHLVLVWNWQMMQKNCIRPMSVAAMQPAGPLTGL
ncbi:MAG: enolase C-terminal domain-like protein [Enterocloster sp.]